MGPRRAHEREVQGIVELKVVDVLPFAGEKARILPTANPLSDYVGHGAQLRTPARSHATSEP